MTTTLSTPQDLLGLVGHDLGTSAWREVTQHDIDTFAEATGDHQWIHVDVERATAGPFGGPIAHGYLTLSLLVPLWADLLTISKVAMGVNYGLNRVRFPSPVPAGSRIRLRAVLADAQEVPGGGIQAVVDGTVEREGSDKPACVAQMVYRYYPRPA